MASSFYEDYHHHVHGNSTKRSQFFSRTYSLSNMVNAHNLETVGESDTWSQRTAEVCQGRPYSETASEDSCSIRRNMSGDNCDTVVHMCNSAAGFSGLKRSFSSRAGRNHFRRQLKEELHKVHNMISILEAREFDIRSFLQMPELEMTNASSSKSAFEPARNKREFFEDTDFIPREERRRTREKPRMKGGVKRALHLNADLQIPKRQKFVSDAKRLADLMRQCGTILKKLRTHKFSWVFNQPVDYVALKIPDYPMIIKQPMDLGTIKSKMEVHAYSSPLEFAADVRLTFKNAMKYNPKGHDVHYMAEFLLKIFEERWINVDRKLMQLPLHYDSTMRIYDEPVETVVQSSRPAVGAFAAMPSRGQKQAKVEEAHLTTPMTYEEKQVLSEMLEDVPIEKLDQVMAIIKRKDPELKPIDGEVTIEIDSLDPDSLWELFHLLKHPKVASKAICQDSKIHGGETAKLLPGHGNVSHVTAGEHDAKEEDVDIGVDVPNVNYAPVHVDKDVAVCSSPSSSSSSGSSSSSDSGSGNSSASDSEGEDVQSRASEVKLCSGKEPPVGSGAVCEPRGSPIPKMDDAKRPLSDLDEELPLSRSDAFEEEHGQGDAFAQDLQHQDKLHRAALLRSRFADTILKAREKTLLSGKSNSSDPEKLRREREELERLQLEERARLQAEAKAAESTRKKVEAAAMEKARREREAQRVAARLVIQQMEKTVDIGETNDYLKDLELLGSAPVDCLPSLDGCSPSDAQNGSAFLPFNCGNPLEQLGLFMRDEEEEEEQETVRPSQQEDKASPPDQNEEGEIDD